MSESYQGQTYRVDRVKNQQGSYEYEFALYVGRERVMSASQLEREGISFDDIPNWTTALKTFAEAYIDTGSKDEAVEHVKAAY